MDGCGCPASPQRVEISAVVAEMRRWTSVDSLYLRNLFWLLRAGVCGVAELRRCPEAVSACPGRGRVVVFDPEHVAVAALVFAGAQDVVPAPPSGLPGQQPAQCESVGQAPGVGGDELPVPPVGDGPV